MLSREDNDLLTRTGPGTAMGRVMRGYWLPALLSTDLQTDGQPMRIRLLGENLVAFRASDGLVGILGEHCAHRGVSLHFARNEFNGLRCVYHGWKFDRSGRCVEMPNEGRNPGLKDAVWQKAYPCVERGGLVWTYMGPTSSPPPLPDLEWLSLPEGHVHLSLRVQECNWLQALEGEMDPSHAPILHSRVDGGGHGPDSYAGMSERAPLLEVVEHDGGVQIGSRRDAGDRYYWRVNHFLMPFWSVVPPGAGEIDINGHAWVPMDDTTTLCVMYSYNPGQAISDRRLKLFQEGHRGREPGHMSVNGALPFDASKPYGKYWPKWNRYNDYGMDYAAQQSKYFSGLAGLWVQDSGCQESMGDVVDRTAEHLCSGDVGIARVRRVLREAARLSGERPDFHPSLANSAAYRRRAVSILLPKDAPWLPAVEEHIHDRGPIRTGAASAHEA